MPDREGKIDVPLGPVQLDGEWKYKDDGVNEITIVTTYATFAIIVVAVLAIGGIIGYGVERYSQSLDDDDTIIIEKCTPASTEA
jgi:hypothetical protein